MLTAHDAASGLVHTVAAPSDTGLFAVTDSVRRAFPVVSACVESADGRLWPHDGVPAALRGSIEDYRLVQYDLLLGRGYTNSVISDR